MVDAWISVTSMAFPEAAPFLEGGKKLLDILGAFDKPDAIQEALKRISLRLDELDARLKNVEQGLNDLQNAFLKEKNWTRFQALERVWLQGGPAAFSTLYMDTIKERLRIGRANTVRDEFASECGSSRPQVATAGVPSRSQ